jgi:hypothetical protein
MTAWIPLYLKLSMSPTATQAGFACLVTSTEVPRGVMWSL